MPQAEVIQVRPKKRGPKGPHKGQFKKGFDSRRQAPIRRALLEEVSAAAQESAPAAIAFLTDVMNSDDHCIKTRIVAAKEILDRGIGQPVAMTHMHHTTGEGGNNTPNSQLPPRECSDAELLAIIQSGLNRDTDDQPIEAQFTETPMIAANKSK